MAGSTGLEPATSGLTVPIVDCRHHPHSQRLAYAPARGRRRGRWRPVATRCAASMTVSVGFKTLTKQIPRGSLLTVHLSKTGVEVAASAQTAVRLGEPEPLTFAVRVPPGCPRGQAFAVATVGQFDVPLGTIRFQISITEHSYAWDPRRYDLPPLGDSVHLFRLGFISYASADQPGGHQPRPDHGRESWGHGVRSSRVRAFATVAAR